MPRPFDVRLWDGTALSGKAEDVTKDAALDVPGRGPSRPTPVLNDPNALGRALTPPLDLSAGEAFVRGDFDVEGDVEDLREHDATTLRRGSARLEERWSDAVRIAGEERARIWRLFMACAAHPFARGRLSVHQVLLGRPDPDGRVEIPPTRDDLYA